MQDLKTLEKRIANLRQTRKMTDSMRMIATLEIRRLQKTVLQSRLLEQHLDAFQDAMLQVDRGARIWGLSTDGEKQHVLLLLVSSERGLAGGFQAALLRRLRQRADAGSGPIDLITLGASVAADLRANSGIRELTVLPYSEHPDAEDAVRVVEQLQHCLKSGNYSSVEIIAERYRKTGAQQAECFVLWPLEPADRTRKLNGSAFSETAAADCEPAFAELAPLWLNFYLRQKLLTILRESRAAEMTLRMMAMSSATDNADEMINRLERERRKSRQARITQEILELTGGSEL